MPVLKTLCFEPKNQAFATTSTSRNVGVNDVFVKTTHSGICFTDVHAKSKGCGLGHEGVGIVREVGTGVTNLKVGDRVGWGWLHSSCGECTTCVTGYRQYCSEARGFAFSDLDQGAFSDGRIINSQFAYRIPDKILSQHAGPLMCAGASVYEALDAAGTTSNDRVGVVGLGGLGHMAVLFAKAMGCAVTIISNNSSKQKDAQSLGADQFHLIGSMQEHRQPSSGMQTSGNSINVLLITSNAVPDLESLLPLLARRATIVLMTIQQEALVIPYMPFILPGHRIIASTEASRENHIKMLEFAARCRIRPWIEEFPMNESGITEAFAKLESGNIRYRGVLGREGEIGS